MAGEKLKAIWIHLVDSAKDVYNRMARELYQNIPKPTVGNLLEPNYQKTSDVNLDAVSKLLGNDNEAKKDAVSKLLGHYKVNEIIVEPNKIVLITENHNKSNEIIQHVNEGPYKKIVIAEEGVLPKDMQEFVDTILYGGYFHS